MAAYKDLVGQKITKVTSNPGEPKTGQMWYNSTNGKLRGLGLVEAWSSGSNTNITRGSGYGFGTLTAGVTGIGEQGPPGLAPAATEEYNGSGWATGNNYPTQVFLIKGTGTQTAGIAAGGRTPSLIANANVYNGTSWTAAGGNLSVAKTDGGMFGIQTAAIYCGGATPTPGLTNDTELYDGSSWSELNNMPVNKQVFATAGTSTAAIASGGRLAPGPSTNSTDEWDGTNWTAGPNINTARRYLQGWGISTSALIAGGSPNGSDGSALSEMYDGTSWSETGDLATARHFSGTCQNQGSNTSGWLANGNAGPTYYSNTEEWNFSTNTITAAAWAAGGSLPTGKYASGSTGSQTAALGVGGSIPPGTYSNTTDEYDGSSWSSGGTYPLSVNGAGAAGTQTSAVAFGGNTYPPSVDRTETNEYDGSSWTSGGALSTGQRGLNVTGFGTQTAAVQSGGLTPGAVSNASNHYNGSSWTSGGTMNVNRYSHAGSGTLTAGLVSGGAGSPPGYAPLSSVEEYNGSSWTATTAMNTVKANTAGTNQAPQTATMVFGGFGPGILSNAELWDGTSWVTSASLSTARGNLGGAGSSSTAGIAFGGQSPPTTTATEEFTPESTAANITDFTTS